MKILITGATGRLGEYLTRELSKEGLSFEGWTRKVHSSFFTIDLRNLEHISARIRDLRPGVVFHLAAAGSLCSLEEQNWINSTVTSTIANECARIDARLIFCSTDMVFSGDHAPYDEDASPHPISNYGRTKLTGEKAVLSLNESAVVVRLPLMYGCTKSRNFFNEQLSALKSNTEMRLFVDEWRTPMSYQNVAQCLVKLMERKIDGIVHFAGPERLSRYEMGTRLAEFLGIRNHPFLPSKQSELFLEEKRPSDLTMYSKKFIQLLPSIKRLTYEEGLRGMGVRLEEVNEEKNPAS